MMESEKKSGKFERARRPAPGGWFFLVWGVFFSLVARPGLGVTAERGHPDFGVTAERAQPDSGVTAEQGLPASGLTADPGTERDTTAVAPPLIPVILPEAGVDSLMVDSLLTVRVTDLTPRFLDFYRAARAEEVTREDRWRLWRERYGFAAVPPTAAGLVQARWELEENWERYPEIMDRIRAGAAGIEPAPAPLLEDVATLLALDRPLDVEIILFVGTGPSVAFSMAVGDRWQVALPVEQEASRREISASHEFAHAVHARLAGFEGDWHRSVGHLILGEGLAMHVARALYPGRSEGAYLGASSEWLETAAHRRREILEGVLGSIDNATPRAADRFTRGPGPAGMDREAYYAGWVLVDHLLNSGWSLAGLAGVPRGLMGRVVEEGLREILVDDSEEIRSMTPNRVNQGTPPPESRELQAASARIQGSLDQEELL